MPKRSATTEKRRKKHSAPKPVSLTPKLDVAVSVAQTAVWGVAGLAGVVLIVAAATQMFTGLDVFVLGLPAGVVALVMLALPVAEAPGTLRSALRSLYTLAGTLGTFALLAAGIFSTVQFGYFWYIPLPALGALFMALSIIRRLVARRAEKAPTAEPKPDRRKPRKAASA